MDKPILVILPLDKGIIRHLIKVDYKNIAEGIDMNMTEIIKDAFLFPSKNPGRFAIYLILSVLLVGFTLGGAFTYAFGFIDADNFAVQIHVLKRQRHQFSDADSRPEQNLKGDP